MIDDAANALAPIETVPLPQFSVKLAAPNVLTDEGAPSMYTLSPLFNLSPSLEVGPASTSVDSLGIKKNHSIVASSATQSEQTADKFGVNSYA